MDFFFIQMTDPQFGMFAALSGMDETRILDLRRQLGWKIRQTPKTTGFAYETALYEKAIAVANRLNPAFVVVCGDMVQDEDDPSQLAELRRITGRLDPHIPIHWVAGNRDVGNTPTHDSLARYRERFGEDQYCFEYGGSSFIVFNSCVSFDDSLVAPEWDRQLRFLRTSLKEAQDTGSTHIVVFTHHPMYAQHRDEDDSWAVIPREKRCVLLDLFEAHAVSAVFSGHWHRNNCVAHGGIQMVASAPVGHPSGDDPSGIRIVKVYPDRIEHQYYGLDATPDTVG